jgi:hypothetical protein
MPRAPLLAAALACALAGATGPVRAGDARSDCLFAFDAASLPAKGKPRIRCVDGDPACDAEPAPGVCRFEVGVCLDRSDPSGRCAPRDLDSFEIENVQPDSDARHDFEFQTLQDVVTSLGLPHDGADTDTCLGPVSMLLPLDVRFRKGGARYRKFKKTLRGTVQGPEAARDDDALPMRCLPAKGANPCSEVTSTLEELERYVFAPTCSRDTCHNGPQADHTLSLLVGEAYANLVGVQPDNVTARRAGKLRVDPGNPANSFLLDKLRGTLDPDEGERMPRGLKKIPSREIALVEGWIAAGAPPTGFVPGLGCQAP